MGAGGGEGSPGWQRLWPEVSAAGLVLAVACLELAYIGAPGFVDDAYITIHNAASLLAGGADPRYAGATALDGATSAPHTVLVALLLLVMPGTWAAWSSCLLGAIAFSLGVMRLARLGRWPSWQALVLVAAALLMGNNLYQLFNGLETSLAMAAVTWALALVADPSRRYRWHTGALLGLMPFLRPELAALSLALGGYLGWIALRAGAERPTRRELVRCAAAALLVAGAWMALYLVITGSPLPSTVGAKRSFFARGCRGAEIETAAMVQAFGRAARDFGPWLACVPLLLATGLGIAGAVFCAAFLAAYYLSFPDALSQYEQRYLYVLAPLLVYALVTARQIRSGRFARLGSALLALVVGFGLLRAPESLGLARGVRGFQVEQLDSAADFAATALPADVPVLVHDAGYIAYATELELVDLVGLKNARARRAHRRWTEPSCGRSRARAVHHIALDAGARYFIVLEGWERGFRFVDGLSALGWSYELVREAPGGYYILRLEPPAAAP